MKKEKVTWESLASYAEKNFKSRSAAALLAWKGRFPTNTIRRKRAHGRVIEVLILASTPWPTRNKTNKKSENPLK